MPAIDGSGLSLVIVVTVAAWVIVMLLLSLLPVWFASGAKVAVAVQPLVVVTFVQSPL